MANIIRTIKVFEALRGHESELRHVSMILNNNRSRKMKFNQNHYEFDSMSDTQKFMIAFFQIIWPYSTYRVCVDGGANDFISLCPQNESIENQRTSSLDRQAKSMQNGDMSENLPTTLNDGDVQITFPDLVCGDFDSISKTTLDYLKANHCTVIETPDQNFTDFEKALCILVESGHLTGIDAVYAVCLLSGQIDHTLSNLSILYKANHLLECIPLYLFSDVDVTFLISDTSSKWIHIDAKSEFSVNRCSIIPIMGTSLVWTRGLYWDLDGNSLLFGHFISISNKFKLEHEFDIKIEGSPVLITIGHDIAKYM
ncbi:hypothetical protein GJ496_004376 [Pomphorhynchus laevis]|nr:hypothetical protein GJ496_004376 [Pomphorhynchus laevis]